MPVRNPSPPYHDTDGISKIRDALFFWFVLAPIALIFIGSFIWWMTVVSDYEIDQRKFMAKCVEFHFADRCFELDKWGRRDLGVVK